jgi:hypothetical protein
MWTFPFDGTGVTNEIFGQVTAMRLDPKRIIRKNGGLRRRRRGTRGR